MDLFGDLFEHSEPEVEDLLAGTQSGTGSSANLHRAAFTPEQSERLFRKLHQNVDWEQQEISVYGKTHLQPRLVAWYGDAGTSYTYSGLTLQPTPWIDPILEIKTVCEAIAGTTFNSVLLNLYRDGDDTVGWHSDDEPTLGHNPIIASVSLGAVRRFDLRHKLTMETVKTPMPAGSVLLMSGRLQVEWSHQVPRTKKVDAPRINLTFRRIRDA
ncbi:alpha-ketoglutarate-dependent dioxygenase AlkB [Halioglobus sp.]|nr:alpha-ketoglutarate-dependent dioxygenase AlkB [Halioglobus sp.]